ncbi:nudC domain-containing protein 2-like, partial [Saccoglossus kowalevskii]
MSDDVHFDETSGIESMKTAWGQWYQTMEEVYVEIDLEEGTKSKEVKVETKIKYLKVIVRGQEIIKGDLFAKVVTNECVWSL